MIAASTLSIGRAGDYALVTCVGELDMIAAERFRQAVDEVLAKKPRWLHVDCSRVSFIDSIGLKALMHTEKRCRTDGISMTVTASPQVRRLLDTLGIGAVFTLAS